MARRNGTAPQRKSRGEAPAQGDAAPSPEGATGRAAENKPGKNARAPADPGSGDNNVTGFYPGWAKLSRDCDISHRCTYESEFN